MSVQNEQQRASTRIRIVLADDHRLVLEGLASCLEVYDHIDLVGTATTADEAIALVSDHAPDVAILDVNMPGLNGLDAAALIRARNPATALMILSMHDNREYIATALSSGVRGYLLKDVGPREIVTAIETVHSGGTYLCSGSSSKLAADMPQNACESGTKLSARERAVLVLLSEGKSNKQVAHELDISIRTVETHRKNLKRKLGIASTAGLTRYVIQNQLNRDGI
jgi:two-component system nitrate/nitrite response regulator NarL